MAQKITIAAIIAAIYATVTLFISFFGLSFGPVQIRIAEGLTLLPILFPEAIYGLFIGCIIANLLSPYTILDIVFGSLTTLVAAWCTYRISKKIKNTKLLYFLAGIPPVLLNALVVPLIMLITSTDTAYFINAAGILLTQAIFVYGVGIPITLLLKKRLPPQ